MSTDNNSPARQGTSYVPALGTLMVDTGHGNRTGEFRGLSGPYWSLRPVSGGPEWEAVPGQVRPPTPAERLTAENARVNTRSRRGPAW
ncbi:MULTISPECIES: hypothetical protein [unclassified Streptomyces]|uniref:hypothetical protein n=1 Tax=unclassified Streptomyces TaxID=2593676 RepID=UPI0032559F1F